MSGSEVIRRELLDAMRYVHYGAIFHLGVIRQDDTLGSCYIEYSQDAAKGEPESSICIESSRAYAVEDIRSDMGNSWELLSRMPTVVRSQRGFDARSLRLAPPFLLRRTARA